MASRPSKCVEYSYPYLIVLAETINTPEIRHYLLQNEQIIKALSELTLNILKQNFSISKKDKQKLQAFRKQLIQLASKGSSKQKHRLLTGKKGGQLLSTILSIGLPILANLLFKKTE